MICHICKVDKCFWTEMQVIRTKDNHTTLVICNQCHNTTMRNTNELRVIKCFYSNGDTITTGMNKDLSDEEMLNYFAVGKWFNIGNTEDNMQQVVKTEILN